MLRTQIELPQLLFLIMVYNLSCIPPRLVDLVVFISFQWTNVRPVKCAGVAFFFFFTSHEKSEPVLGKPPLTART